MTFQSRWVISNHSDLPLELRLTPGRAEQVPLLLPLPPGGRQCVPIPYVSPETKWQVRVRACHGPRARGTGPRAGCCAALHPLCAAPYPLLDCTPSEMAPPTSGYPPPPGPPPGSGVCIWMPLVTGTGNSSSLGRPTPRVVKQDKSSWGSVVTIKTCSDPQRVRMSSSERPIGAAKGTQPDTEALCQTPPRFHGGNT